VEQLVSKDTTLLTDDSTSYVDLKDKVAKHELQVINKELISEKITWEHVNISNAKRILLNTYHDIKPEYLQSYLNELYYKFNRRYYGESLFERLLISSTTHQNQFRSV
jgi:hypothetical protein